MHISSFFITIIVILFIFLCIISLYSWWWTLFLGLFFVVLLIVVSYGLRHIYHLILQQFILLNETLNLKPSIPIFSMWNWKWNIPVLQGKFQDILLTVTMQYDYGEQFIMPYTVVSTGVLHGGKNFKIEKQKFFAIYLKWWQRKKKIFTHDENFDYLYQIITPNPDFARTVLDPEIRQVFKLNPQLAEGTLIVADGLASYKVQKALISNQKRIEFEPAILLVLMLAKKMKKLHDAAQAK